VNVYPPLICVCYVSFMQQQQQQLLLLLHRLLLLGGQRCGSA
jgi:hypothetical protein